jgi:hypothetical protein
MGDQVLIDLLKEFAESSPTAETGDMFHECSLCNVALVTHLRDHDSDCLWRRAREELLQRGLVNRYPSDEDRES